MLVARALPSHLVLAHVALSEKLVQSGTKENLLLWASTAVGLALLPLGFGALIKWLVPTFQLAWLDLLKDGQLFFFATALSGDSLNRLIAAQQAGSDIASSLFLTFNYVALAGVVLVSALCFAISVFVTTHGQLISSQKLQGSAIKLDAGRVVVISAACAVGAVILSLFVFLFGGGQ